VIAEGIDKPWLLIVNKNMNDAEKEGQTLQKAITNRIRELRSKKNWSLDKLGNVTGLSKGYLSQIENCEKNPPISPLTKIAFGLGEDVFVLITREPKAARHPKFSIVRAAERKPIIHRGAQSRKLNMLARLGCLLRIRFSQNAVDIWKGKMS
jgi:transcriptional regulator with XRE-family HTH domain